MLQDLMIFKAYNMSFIAILAGGGQSGLYREVLPYFLYDFHQALFVSLLRSTMTMLEFNKKGVQENHTMLNRSTWLPDVSRAFASKST